MCSVGSLGQNRNLEEGRKDDDRTKAEVIKGKDRQQEQVAMYICRFLNLDFCLWGKKVWIFNIHTQWNISLHGMALVEVNKSACAPTFPRSHAHPLSVWVAQILYPEIPSSLSWTGQHWVPVWTGSILGCSHGVLIWAAGLTLSRSWTAYHVTSSRPLGEKDCVLAYRLGDQHASGQQSSLFLLGIVLTILYIHAAVYTCSAFPHCGCSNSITLFYKWGSGFKKTMWSSFRITQLLRHELAEYFGGLLPRQDPGCCWNRGQLPSPGQ